MNIRYRKAGRLFNRILKLTLGKYLVYRFNVKGLTGELPRIAPPYLVLANHPGFWDPFILSVFVKDPIHFVTSDEYFRNPLLRILLSLVGAIPKSKFISDSETVKGIFQIIKNNGVIGIFPEGGRTWDGRTAPLLFPTSKLIKKLGVPVVTARFRGGFLSSPRWAKYKRRGEITVEYSIALSSEKIKEIDAKEIHSIITSKLAHDEYQYQEGAKIRFKGRKLAENLELFLFTCPCCKSLDTLSSSGSVISCACGFRACINEYGFFEGGPENFLFKTPLEWNDWQQENLRNILYSHSGKGSLISNENVVFKSGGRLAPFRNAKRGNLMLYMDSLVFTGLDSGTVKCDLEGISGLNVQYNDMFEFYYQKELYRFSFYGRKMSAFKWVCAVDWLKAR
jgi:1-acyl-sn-glycerol-3-phosphate acyltransferase